jgi:Tol biopolymer transport system component
VAGFFLLQAQNCSSNVGNTTTGPFTFRVSSGPNDVQADGQSGTPTVSADGRYVAFTSEANNLAILPTTFREVFVKDRQTGLVQNISQMANALNPADCDLPFISADGQWVVYQSKATYDSSFSLNPETTTNIYFVNRATGSRAQFVVGLGVGWPDHDCTNASIASSNAGASLWVVFQSAAQNINPNNPVADLQIYATDVKAVLTKFYIVSHNTTNSTTFGNANSRNPVISADGSTVAFSSTSSDLITGGVFTENIYIGTPAAGAVTLVSSANGAPLPTGNGVSLKPSISSNGNLVAFTCRATNLVAGATGSDVLLRNISAQTTTLAATGVLAFSGLPGNIGFPLGLSDDGRFIAYTLKADQQIYVRDMMGGTVLGSAGQFGGPGDLGSVGAVLSPDGQWLFWQSGADNLVLEDTNGATDVFGRGPLH